MNPHMQSHRMHHFTPAADTQYKRRMSDLRHPAPAADRCRNLELLIGKTRDRLRSAEARTGHAVALGGLVLGAAGCLSVIGAATVTELNALSAMHSLIIAAPGIIMVLAGVIVSAIGEFSGDMAAARRDRRSGDLHAERTKKILSEPALS